MVSTSFPLIYTDDTTSDPLVVQLQIMLNGLVKASDVAYYYVFYEAINPTTLSPGIMCRIKEYLSNIGISARIYSDREAHQCALYIFNNIETLMSKLNERLPELDNPFSAATQAKLPSPIR